jgi:putative IMPACT (imprinted ancient) family translation regulator
MTMKRLDQSRPHVVVVERSRFIGQTFAITDEQRFADIHDDFAHRHPGHSHIAWAYRVGPGRERASDGGEPQGTAGLPILYIIQKQDCIETGIAVVRYFGGIKLGRGGLIRAYERAAQGALAESLWQVAIPAFRVQMPLSYPDHAALAPLLDRMGVRHEERFGARVHCTFHCPEPVWAEFARRVSAQTGQKLPRPVPETLWHRA